MVMVRIRACRGQERDNAERTAGTGRRKAVERELTGRSSYTCLGCVLRMKQTLADAVARDGYSAVMRRIPLVTHFHWSERWHTESQSVRFFGIAERILCGRGICVLFSSYAGINK